MHSEAPNLILRAMRMRALAACLALGLAVLVMGGTATAAPPSTPEITEPGLEGPTVHPGDVHMEAGGFSDSDGGTLACSDWEIWTVSPSEKVWESPCAAGVLANHIHLGDGSFVGSYAGRLELHYETAYSLRVRFKDSNGEYGAYATRAFQTAPQGPPGVPGETPWAVLQPNYVVEKVAGDLQLPVNIAFVPNPGTSPNDPLFYVTELYGKIKVVTNAGQVSDYATGLLNFDPTGNFPGSGEIGLTGIVVDPASGDVFASMVYEDPGPTFSFYNKVVRFHSTDGGLTADTPADPAILDFFGEGTGPSHQISNLTIGPDGKLYVHVGDGLIVPNQAQNLDTVRGKILRSNLDGSAPSDNPLYDAGTDTSRDYILAYGFRNPFGGEWRASNGAHYEVENGKFGNDRLARIDIPAATAVNYGYDGSDASMLTNALYLWSPSHAPVNIAFTEPQTFSGSGFPAEKMDHAFVTESGPAYATGPQVRGKRIVEFAPDASGELGNIPAQTLVEYNGTGKASAIGLAAGPDGLYFTDLYKDLGASSATDPGANVWRIRYAPQSPAVQSPASDSSPAPASFSFNLKAAVRRCKRKFSGKEFRRARARCIRKARRKAATLQ
jgi:glucose/arabinose dehydrogenase